MGWGWLCYVKSEAPSPVTSVIVTPPARAIVTLQFRSEGIRALRGKHAEVRGRTASRHCWSSLTLISKSDHGTIPSHTFFFFFMDGTQRIKLGGRQSHPVIFPENIMIGPQRIIKTAGWEVVTLTGTVLLSSIENNYFPDGIIQRSLFNSGIISIFERYFNPLHPVIVFLLATRWC